MYRGHSSCVDPNYMWFIKRNYGMYVTNDQIVFLPTWNSITLQTILMTRLYLMSYPKDHGFCHLGNEIASRV